MIIGRVFRIILNFLLWILSYIVPKEKNTILAGSTQGKAFRGNSKYFYLYCVDKKHDGVFWITENKELFEKLKRKKYPVVYLFSLQGFFKILRSEYLIITENGKDVSYNDMLFGNFNVVQTYHASPIKKVGVNHYEGMKTSFVRKIFNYLDLKQFRKYKFILTPSKEVSSILSSAFANKNVIITGNPRNDVFFDKTLIWNKYEEKLNLGKYKKIILYSPTYRDNNPNLKPFSDKFLEKFNKYLKSNKFLFIIKNHPSQKSILTKKYSHIVNYSKRTEDIQEMFLLSDILISDYSSVIFDFILLNRPFILYSYDYDEYIAKNRELYYDYFKDMVGPFAMNEEELFNLIKNSEKWFNKRSYQKKYQKLVERFNKYKDGKSSERLMRKLKD